LADSESSFGPILVGNPCGTRHRQLTQVPSVFSVDMRR
jgi:hypothetical protein